ncbi:DUF2514 family protein [Cupriavidus respiraculi]|uniref:DUF2514 family protein n=1 Tax=Cupriavidus respiraculi TaxID=195930 RepID=UPI001CC4CB6B|nr:DUF2514 family protein [Cupriavidus respiraculi]
MIPTNAMRAAAAAVPWRAVAAVGVAVLAFGIGWTVNGWRKDSQIDRLVAQQAEERRVQADEHVRAVDAARLEEQRRTAAQMEIANAAAKELEGARRNARDAGAAADRLRNRVAELVAASRAGQDSGPAGAGPATGGPVGMLADVLQRADRRAGLLAEYADGARIAGQACERSYDSLNAASP